MAGQEEIRRLMKEAKHKASGTSSSKPTAPKAAPNPPQKVLPAGFFDDSVADAKARNVDVKQLAEQQLDADWEAFQEFADEVEQQNAQEEQDKAEEGKEREAEEQLENMQYVDRYRVALERAAALRSGKDKRKLPTDDTVQKDGEEQAGAVEEAVNQLKKQKRPKRQLDADSDDDFDPCNWRSRGI